MDQNTGLQLDALRRAGVTRVFQDKASGVGARPELVKALSSLRFGDQFVVWKLDRVARSLLDLLAIIDRVNESGAHIRSLTEPIDTGSPYGRFTLQVLGAAAELERNIIRERVRAGQRAAMERGQVFGRSPVMDDAAMALAEGLYGDGFSLLELAEVFGVSYTAVRSALRRRGVKLRPPGSRLRVVSKVQH